MSPREPNFSQLRTTVLGRFQKQLHNVTEERSQCPGYGWYKVSQAWLQVGTQSGRCGKLGDVACLSCSLSLLSVPSCLILREQGWADWESLLNVTACPAGSLPLSIKDDSYSLWQPFSVGQLFCLTDQFCSHWVGRTSFHLSWSSQVWAGSKQQKGTLVNTGKINHWLFA